MSYRVQLRGPADRYLKHLDKPAQNRIDRRIEAIGENPFGAHSKRVAGTRELYTSRVGGWRLIFEINRPDQVVTIMFIAPRGQVYRNL